jgi:DNA-directed RNA polymerase subunit RPC12/RpoP
MFCTACHEIDKPATRVKGSLGLEILLWLLLIVPGLIYSLWRSTSAARVKQCRHCGSRELVPPNSRRATNILNAETVPPVLQS